VGAVVAQPVDGGRRRSTGAARIEWIAVAVVSVVGGALVWWSTARRGPGLTSDSVAYLSTAQNIVAGRGFGSWLQMPLTHWPLGYPVVLAGVAEVTGLSVLDAARVIGVAVAVATTWASWRLAVRVVTRPLLRVVAVVAIGVAVATIDLQNKLLTDAAFTLVGLVFLLALLRVLDATSASMTSTTMSSTAWLAIAVVLAWSGFLLRYQGVVLAVVGAAILLAFPLGAPLRARVRNAVAVGLGGSVLPAIYLVATLSDFRADQRNQAPAHPVVQGLGGVLRAVAEWAVGRTVPDWLVAGGAVLLVGLAAAVVLVVGRAMKQHSEPSSDDAALAVIGCYWLGVLVLLVLVRTVVYFDTDSRTLNLLYPLLVVFGVALLDRVSSRPLMWTATAALVLWCLVVVQFGVRTARGVRTDGSGFTASALDQTYAELRGADLPARLADCSPATNAPEILFLAGVEAAGLAAPDAATGDPPAGRSTCVVWVDGASDPTDPALDRSAILASHHLGPPESHRTFTVYRAAGS
jgi:hypothetical protein